MTATLHRDQTVAVAGLKIQLVEGGAGPPLIVLHHDVGSSGWPLLYEALTSDARVLAPDLPGYGQSDRPDWARHPRDLAILLNLLFDKLDVGQATLVGLGFGGWIAAEMATMNQRRFSRMVLVGAMGLRPPQGEIADQMMMSLEDYVRSGFSDAGSYERQFGAEIAKEQRHDWDLSREMTARVNWKPIMCSLQLPHLLAAVEIPTLVVWGEDDRIVPLSCGEAYARGLPNARLEIVKNAGHFVDLEQPEVLARLIAGQ
ncbi:MAG: alpha/beta fold hydrolase [Dehalococcoidia bacterium]